jgi:hypothetical protein
MLMGINKPFRRKGLEAVFYYQTIIQGAKRKFTGAELSWVSEDNQILIQELENLNAKLYKRYRIFRNELNETSVIAKSMKKRFHYFNIPLVELTLRLFQSGRISFKGTLVLFSYYLKLILALPQHFFYSFFTQKKLRRQNFKRSCFYYWSLQKRHYYLHKLIASDKRFGFLSNFDSVFPTQIFSWKTSATIHAVSCKQTENKNPFFNNSIAQLGDPAEEDHFLISKASAFSAYWRFIFPLRSHEWLNGSKQFGEKKYCEQWKREYLDTVKFITFKNKGRQLVLKNPPNTERIKYLLELFPNAKFIYLFRNPIMFFVQ